MSPGARRPSHEYERFPRVSGDEPGSGRGFTVDVLFSPRERG